jgi:sugar phosphate permease
MRRHLKAWAKFWLVCSLLGAGFPVAGIGAYVREPVLYVPGIIALLVGLLLMWVWSDVLETEDLL